MDRKIGRRWLWLIALTVAWPALQFLIFLVRFGRLSGALMLDSLSFAPLGLLSGLLLIILCSRAGSALGRNIVIAGYVIATPAALVTSLLGGLIWTPVVGVTIFGLIPLAVGMYVAFAVAKLIKPSDPTRPAA
jgi:hypothetical protein